MIAPADARRPPLPPPVHVLGHPVHPVGADEAAAWVLAASRSDAAATRSDAAATRSDAAASQPGEAVARLPRTLVVTINPEMIVRARSDAELAEAIAGAGLVLADGVGVTWAARRAGHRLPGRVPGVDLVSSVLASGGATLRVAFLGGRPGVAARAAAVAAERWGTRATSVHDGYFDARRDAARIVDEIAAGAPELVLAGLGERQEAFLWRHRHALGPGVAIGVGGTLDVLAGAVTRSPEWTRRFGVEWAYRVGLDPKRWHRAPRLATFVAMVLAPRLLTRPATGPGRP